MKLKLWRVLDWFAGLTLMLAMRVQYAVDNMQKHLDPAGYARHGRDFESIFDRIEDR